MHSLRCILASSHENLAENLIVLLVINLMQHIARGEGAERGLACETITRASVDIVNQPLECLLLQFKAIS